jgi:excisionase family DNA binding protein
MNSSTPSSQIFEQAEPTRSASQSLAARIAAVEQAVASALRQLETAHRQLQSALAETAAAQERVREAVERARSTQTILISMREAEKALGVSTSILYPLIMRGELRSIKLGGRRLIPVSELEAFVKRRIEAEFGPDR